MHTEAYEFVRRTLAFLPAPHRVLEFGSRDVNGSVRPLFPTTATYVGTDVLNGPGVDIVASGATYRPPPPETPDVVVCCEVLEHTEDAPAIVRNALRVVRAGGAVIITCAGPDRAPHSAVDGAAVREGEFYHNVRAEDVQEWLALCQDTIDALEVFAGRGGLDLYVFIAKKRDRRGA